MLYGQWLMVAAMLLFPGSEQKENPWVEKVAPAVEKAKRDGTVAALREALDAAWRADDWQAGAELARQALDKHPDAPHLIGPVARALWRAGRLTEAERLVARLPETTDDRVGLAMLIVTHMARGEKAPAAKAGERLLKLDHLTAEDLFYVLGARSAMNRLKGAADLARRAAKVVDADNGYPENLLGEQLGGMPEFFDAIGEEPLNQISGFGSAPMNPIPLINLPGCEVFINGHGPYRVVVDTGGSVTVSVDDQVAAELGLKSIAQTAIHGVSGKSESGQALIDELRIGGITCRRVVTRIFGVRAAIAQSADIILGTGLFDDGRMTLDFQNGRLVVGPPSERPAAGREAPLRIIGDSKLMVPIELKGEPAVALFDSGADAFAVSPSRLKQIFPGRHIRSVSAPLLGVGEERNPSLSLTPGVSFVLAGRKFDNYGGLGLDVLDTLLSPMLGVQMDVLIGMPVMRGMKTLTVDFPHRRMWVDWMESN